MIKVMGAVKVMSFKANIDIFLRLLGLSTIASLVSV